MSKAAFSGNYVDMKFIRSRSACQVVIEIPIERASDFIAAFGAPDPSVETPVAIARLHPKAIAEPSEASPDPPKDKKRWDELPPSQQAAIRCNEAGFQRFIDQHSSEDAAVIVREKCGVLSRSELDKQPKAAARWRELDDAYICHMRGYEGLRQ